MKWRLTGFSPLRVAWIITILLLVSVPSHFYVSCEMSRRIGLSVIVLFIIVGGLSLAAKNPRPFVIATVGLIAHMLGVH
jgi:hypothetical protein